jgi:hypothetical protein
LTVVAQGPAGIPSTSQPLSLIIDRTGPKARDLTARIRNDRVAMGENGATKTIVRWSVADPLSPVRTSTLQQRSDDRPWRAVGSGHSAKVTLKPGRKDSFRVRSMDSLGNSARSAALPVALSVRDSNSPAWRQPARGWQARSVGAAFGGSLLMADAASGKLLMDLSGNNVAVVAPVGPRRGTFRLRVDGGSWQEVNLSHPKGLHRRIVFSRRLEDGDHSLEIRPLAGQTAIDAVLTTQ